VIQCLNRWGWGIAGQAPTIEDSRGAEYDCQWTNFKFSDVGEVDIPEAIVSSTGGVVWGYTDDNGQPLPTSYMRLREGIERFFITDINNAAGSAKAQSAMAIMWDAWSPQTSFFAGSGDQGVGRFNHVPGGSNVLYMDGHASFIKYGSEYPVWAPTSSPSGLPLVQEAGTWMPFAGGWG
jgi:prepilin-type processing-associated H-X9-DG protein